MYNDHIIDLMKEHLNEQLKTINSEITGEITHYQGFLLGSKSIIDYVLGVIDIGKEDK